MLALDSQAERYVTISLPFSSSYCCLYETTTALTNVVYKQPQRLPEWEEN